MAGIAMGIGDIGDPSIILKRKFRWTFAVNNVCGTGNDIPDSFVKLAARPSLTIEDTEINHLNAKKWIPGKASWETITVTYYDVASNDNAQLWNWLVSVYNFMDPTNLQQGTQGQDYAAVGVLTMYDGAGTALETWTLEDMWPSAINFGDVDYSSSDEADIELTLRYSKVTYKSNCPGLTIQGCYTACA